MYQKIFFSKKNWGGVLDPQVNFWWVRPHGSRAPEQVVLSNNGIFCICNLCEYVVCDQV